MISQLARKKAYQLKNRIRILAYKKAYRLKNKAKLAEAQKLFRSTYKHLWVRYSAERRALKVKQTPTLSENEKNHVDIYYKVSTWLGKNFHVDHILPLSKGGLHHPTNLQIIPAYLNLAKGNSTCFIIPDKMKLSIKP